MSDERPSPSGESPGRKRRRFGQNPEEPEKAPGKSSARLAESSSGQGPGQNSGLGRVCARRRFVSLAGLLAASVACCGVGATAYALEGENELLRPPGGQDERAFLAACVKCDRCRSVCPTGALAVAHVEDGFVRARTPKFDFHKGYCDFCGKCQEVCGTGALSSFDPSQDKVGVAVVQKDRCLAYDQGCESCKDSCPFGALAFDAGRHPSVDPQLCNGCGSCEYQCVALVYGTFAGGTRRGIVVVNPQTYEELGTTLVEGDGGDA